MGVHLGRIALHFKDGGPPVMMTWFEGGNQQARTLIGMEVEKDILAQETGETPMNLVCGDLMAKKNACVEAQDYAGAARYKEEIEAAREALTDQYLRGKAAGKCPPDASAAFLVVDPRYSGPDEVEQIAGGGWCSWLRISELIRDPKMNFTFLIPKVKERDTGSMENFACFDSLEERALGANP